MGKQIIRQPNGLYAIWSTVVQNIIFYDATPDEIIYELVEECREDISRDVHRVIDELKEGQKPYAQFTKTFEEALDLVAERHDDGEMQRDEILARMEKTKEEPHG
jgi:hypothetical protein